MSLKPLEVKTVNIATKAVTSEKIADNAIETRHIKNGAVTADKLTIMPAGRPLTPGLETSEIKDGAITSGKIAPNAVTSDHIAANAVATEDIKDGAITREKIRDGSVTKEKMADGIIGTAEIIDGSITAAKLATNSVTNAKIATNAITKAKMADNSVGYAEIASQSLEPKGIKTISGAPATEGQIPVADLSQGNQWWFRWVTPGAAARPLTPPLTSAELGTGSVESDKIAAGAVASSQLAVDSVSSEKLQANAVTSAKIEANAVVTEKLQDGCVTQEKLAPGVGGDRFVWGAEGQSGNPRASADVMYLTDISSPISYTPLDLSPWVPAGAKGVLLQIGIFNQAFTSGRAFFRVRTNIDQRDAIGVGLVPGGFSQNANAGLVPLVVGTGPRTVEYALESVGGPWVGTLTLYVTVVGYIL